MAPFLFVWVPQGARSPTALKPQRPLGGGEWQGHLESRLAPVKSDPRNIYLSLSQMPCVSEVTRLRSHCMVATVYVFAP